MINVTEKILNTILEDDNTPTGGVSFAGETVKDFIEEAKNNGVWFNTLEELNLNLKECGIKPVYSDDYKFPIYRVKFWATKEYRDIGESDFTDDVYFSLSSAITAAYDAYCKYASVEVVDYDDTVVFATFTPETDKYRNPKGEKPKEADLLRCKTRRDDYYLSVHIEHDDETDNCDGLTYQEIKDATGINVPIDELLEVLDTHEHFCDALRNAEF